MRTGFYIYIYMCVYIGGIYYCGLKGIDYLLLLAYLSKLYPKNHLRKGMIEKIIVQLRVVGSSTWEEGINDPVCCHENLDLDIGLG
jgi:hypothetical protein